MPRTSFNRYFTGVNDLGYPSVESHGYNKKRLAENGKSYMSGKRGSNPRPPAWKASALSTELFPHDFLEIGCKGNEKSHYMQVYREITVIFPQKPLSFSPEKPPDSSVSRLVPSLSGLRPFHVSTVKLHHLIMKLTQNPCCFLAAFPTPAIQGYGLAFR